MKYINSLVATAFAAFSVLACTEEEALPIQGVDAVINGQKVNADKQSEEYYASIRAYKKSEHKIAFGFYTAWHALEGSNGEVSSPASYGQRLIGLPDSLDIADLWMAIPSDDPEDPEYAPVTMADMKFCQEKLGTKFVSHEDMSHNQVFTWGTWHDDAEDVDKPVYYNILKGRGVSGLQDLDNFQDHFDSKPKVGYDEDHPIGGSKGMQEACYAYAHWCVERMRKGKIDGIDFDYEPNDATWTSTTAAWVISECAKFIGGEYEGGRKVADFPEKDVTKLLMVNFFGGEPGSGCAPYVDYVVNQCYAWQIGTNVMGWLGRRPSWCPLERFILNDSIGGEAKEAYLYGGKPCEYNGEKMYSMEAMARLCRDHGVGGFGAYYIDRNYMSLSGTPYREFRRDICIANGADMKPYYVE